jgi:hypothetical protein
MAYVSHLSQVPEETAHLFALVHQASDLKSLGEMTLEDALGFELRFMSLHECFAKFSTNLIVGKSQVIPRSQGKTKLETKDIWELAHREGYYLAQALTRRFFSGQVNRSQLIDWFNCDWTQQRGLVSMRRIYRLTQESPVSKHFL